jgi:hypothetical protein
MDDVIAQALGILQGGGGHILGHGVDDMDGAELLGKLPPLRDGLDQGDVGAAGHVDRLEGKQADGAAAADGHALAEFYLSLVHDAGGDGDGLPAGSRFLRLTSRASLKTWDSCHTIVSLMPG